MHFIAHADDGRVGNVFSDVCGSVCLSVYCHNISKTDAARISKRDTEINQSKYFNQSIFKVA